MIKNLLEHKVDLNTQSKSDVYNSVNGSTYPWNE